MSIELRLAGCRRLPLADYLKGLGVFRIVAEQLEPRVRARWSQGVLVLQGDLDRDALIDFFTSAYLPTPIVAPWNGGSGFYAKDTQTGIQSIERSRSERFATYREAIARCRALVERFRLVERPKDDQKRSFIEHVRSVLPDEAMRWIDAAVALEDDGPAFPPLLGTGGNDGRLDFSNNQMQRLAEVLLDTDGAPSLLRAALFDDPAANLARVAIGQFRPASAGGPNAIEGFDRDSIVNPWDYILTLEGALVFAVAISRRAEAAAPGSASFPFTVRASAAGYGSATDVDASKARDEMWLPIWSRAASYPEIAVLFGEGRARIGKRAARNGVDFARAIASLGTDRGIEEFTRIGFLVRNGLSYFATPLGDWQVARSSVTGLLVEIDDWLAQLERAATSKNAPGSLRRAAANVETAILSACQRSDAETVSELLIALGQVEAVCARSPAVRSALRPISELTSAWADAADDGSSEFRLAASLCAGGIHAYLSPARRGPRTSTWAVEDEDCVWADRPLIDNMVAVAQRREARDTSPSLDGCVPAIPYDVVALLDGTTDDARVQALIWGLCAISWQAARPIAAPQERALPAVFSIARLALARHPAPGMELPETPGVLARLASGDAVAATRLAERRLRGAGLMPRCGPLAATREQSRRTAAALLLPLSSSTLAAMRRQVIRTSSLENA